MQCLLHSLGVLCTSIILGFELEYLGTIFLFPHHNRLKRKEAPYGTPLKSLISNVRLDGLFDQVLLALFSSEHFIVS